MFEHILVNNEKLYDLMEAGVIKDLVEKSKVYFAKGTYKYPGADYTEKEIEEADLDAIANHWFELASSFTEEGKPADHPGRRLYTTLLDGYPINLQFMDIKDGVAHLCNNLSRPDSEGTKNYIFKLDFHNTIGTTWLKEGCTIERSYTDIGSPMRDTFQALANYFAPIEECSGRLWSTFRYIGQETQHYSTGGENWHGIKSDYSVTFDVFEVDIGE